MVTTPELGLVVWNLSTDPYDSGQLAENFYRVDQHDHTSGKGKPITTGAIKDAAITQEKMAPGVSLPSSSIAPGQVGNAELGSNAVTSNKIQDGTVTGNDIAPNTVASGNIVDGTVQGIDIAPNTIASGNILDGTIAAADLGPSAVTLAKLAAGVGTRLLGAAQVENMTATGSSTAQGFDVAATMSLAHHGKDVVAVLIVPQLVVSGPVASYTMQCGIVNTPSGGSGNYTPAAGVPGNLFTPTHFSVGCVVSRTALTGNHTWNAFLIMNINSPQTVSTQGTGLLAIFEQY